jgi:hypothetical protein
MSRSPTLIIPALILVTSISACGREDYTTWSCKDASGSKHTMILKQAQMSFENQQFDFCGSLGPKSYFDLRCPAQPQDSSKVFIPSSGDLISNGASFQCNAL